MNHTLLLGLIGAGIQRSLTPALQEAEAAAHGLDCEYRRLDLDLLPARPLEQLLRQVQAEGYRGVNVTFPCKQEVIPLLDELDATAAALGAVNTVVFEGGRRLGRNTDAPGFAEGFRNQLPGVASGRVVQLGAGGAGAAVAHAILAEGAAQLDLFDHDLTRAEALAAQLCARFGMGRAEAGLALPLAMAGADGLIHATPTGMAKFPGLPLDAALLRPELWVAEVVYVPLETALLQAARRLGCRVAHGGGMAVHQAAHAFRHFTGLEPDAARMTAHFARLVAA